MMLTRLRKLLAQFRGELPPDPLRAVQPRVTPDPQDAAELERRWAEIAHCPENGFHRDRRQQKSNVVPMRRRTR